MDVDQRTRLDHVFAKWDKTSTAQQQKATALNYGKDKWTEKFGCNPAPIPRLGRTFRTPSQRVKLQQEGYRGFLPNLGTSIARDIAQIHSKCCYKCTPQSRQEWQAHSDKPIDFTKAFPTKRLGLLNYWCNDLYTCSRLHTTVLPPALQQAVLSSHEVEGECAKYSNASSAQRTAHSLYRKMAAQSSAWLARAAGWLLIKVFRFSTTGVIARSSDVDVLRQAVQRGVPLLYLPLHRSHLDYMILTWVLCLLGLPPPFVAAGDNLDLPVVGSVLRKLGAFFIRRRTKEDQSLYKAVLDQYVIELVKAGCSVEFFLEGRRSRSGLINPTKIGLLTNIVNAVRAGDVADVLICPLSLTYDKTPEDSLTQELRGASKEPESFLSALWHALTFPFQHNYGNICINFSEPFSLVEYVEKSYRDVREAGDDWNSLADVSQEGMLRLTKRLGEHILHTGMMTSSITSTALVSVLLLSAKGPLSQLELEKCGHVWYDIVRAAGGLCGFSLEPGYLSQCLTMFTSILYTDQWCIGGTLSTVYSKGSDVDVELLLHYYSAPLILATLPLTTLCISLTKIVKTDGSKTYISKTLLMQRAQYCCSIVSKLLKAEAPCTPIDQVLSFHLDALFTLNVLKVQQNAMSTEELRRLQRAAAQWEDTAEWSPAPLDDQLLVNEAGLAVVETAALALVPYLDLIAFVLNSVSEPAVQPAPKPQFISGLAKQGFESGRNGLCSSIVHITGVVDKLCDIGVMSEGVMSEGVMSEGVMSEGGLMSLSPAYSNTQQLLNMVAYLSTYT